MIWLCLTRKGLALLPPPLSIFASSFLSFLPPLSIPVTASYIGGHRQTSLSRCWSPCQTTQPSAVWEPVVSDPVLCAVTACYPPRGDTLLLSPREGKVMLVQNITFLPVLLCTPGMRTSHCWIHTINSFYTNRYWPVRHLRHLPVCTYGKNS